MGYLQLYKSAALSNDQRDVLMGALVGTTGGVIGNNIGKSMGQNLLLSKHPTVLQKIKNYKKATKQADKLYRRFYKKGVPNSTRIMDNVLNHFDSNPIKSLAFIDEHVGDIYGDLTKKPTSSLKQLETLAVGSDRYTKLFNKITDNLSSQAAKHKEAILSRLESELKIPGYRKNLRDLKYLSRYGSKYIPKYTEALQKARGRGGLIGASLGALGLGLGAWQLSKASH
jgi:hypothetical protein